MSNDPSAGHDPLRPVGIEARIAELVAPTLTDLGYELVRIAVLGRDRPTVQIMADRADGVRFTVDDCERISHAAGAVLDVANPLTGAWTLEISSPGIDRPLTRLKDWTAHLGHQARAELDQPVAGRRRVTGLIVGADAEGATLRLDDGTDFAFPFTTLRRAKLLLTDALIAATMGEEEDAADAAPPRPAPPHPARPPRPRAKGTDNARRRAN